MLRSRGSDLGGKSRVAHLVWKRFGNVRTYVEPFYGSGAVALARQVELARLGIDWQPGQTIETVNDADCYLANFWRAVKYSPDEVAELADWPVNEADLHARHGWLVAQSEFRERMMDPAEPDYFDARIAAWWVWGLSCWIGSGWCCVDGSARQQGMKRPDLQRNGQGLGVHARAPGRQRGMGLHGHRVSQKMPQVQVLHAGSGVHKRSLKMPDSYYRGGKGVHGQGNNLIPWFQALAERLRPARVVCGDFERVTGKSVVLPDSGYAGLFFDPPYPATADRHEEIYSVDCGDVAHRAAAIALEWGKNLRVRVAFCGYEGTHDFPGWEEVAWKASGGYGGGQGKRGEKNRGRERIWFSPACLKPSTQLLIGME